MPLPFTHRPTLFDEFRSIPPTEHHAVIRFYERYEGDFSFLPAQEVFEMRYHYANALFGIGEAQRYLDLAEDLIQDSMANNWQYIGQEDVFLTTLAQKARALQQLHRYPAAEKIALALCRIQPKDKQHRKLLRSCYTLQRPRWVLEAFALALWLGIMGISLGIANILVFEAFFADFAEILHHIALSSAAMSLLLLSLGILGQWYWVEAKMRASKQTLNK
jgi:hypothetical protein